MKAMVASETSVLLMTGVQNSLCSGCWCDFGWCWLVIMVMIRMIALLAVLTVVRILCCWGWLRQEEWWKTLPHCASITFCSYFKNNSYHDIIHLFTCLYINYLRKKSRLYHVCVTLDSTLNVVQRYRIITSIWGVQKT